MKRSIRCWRSATPRARSPPPSRTRKFLRICLPPSPKARTCSASCRCRTTRLATCRWRRATLQARSHHTASSLAIRDGLAKSDPGDAVWQRDLSVSHEKVGDVQLAQGDLAGALTSYRDSLAIADRLAKSDPGNAGWQRDLLVSHIKVGDVQKFRRAILPARSNPTATVSPLPTGLQNPVPATPAGSVIWRCLTTRLATCRWR